MNERSTARRRPAEYQYEYGLTLIGPTGAVGSCHSLALELGLVSDLEAGTTLLRRRGAEAVVTIVARHDQLPGIDPVQAMELVGQVLAKAREEGLELAASAPEEPDGDRPQPTRSLT